MADVEIGDIVLIKIIIVLGGNIQENVFHAIAGQDATASELLDAADDWMSTCYATIQGNLANDYDTLAVEAFNVTQERPLGSGTVSWAGGTSSGQYLPTGVAACVTFPTATSRKRGRKFIGGITEDQQNDSVWDSGFVSDLATWADKVLDDGPYGAANINLTYVVVSGTGPGAVASAPTGHVIRNVPAYQRRRKAGVGI